LFLYPDGKATYARRAGRAALLLLWAETHFVKQTPGGVASAGKAGALTTSSAVPRGADAARDISLSARLLRTPSLYRYGIFH